MGITAGLQKYFGALRATGGDPGVGPIKGKSGIKIGAPVPSTLHASARKRLMQAYLQAKEAQGRMMGNR